jgi:hypothetical protein
MPAGHRTSRVLILAVVAALALGAGFSDALAGSVTWAADRGGRITSYLWQPLLHGGGWAGPVMPAPSATPAPSAPAPAKVKARKKATPKPSRARH